MTHSKHRGHPIEFTNSTWIYSDNKQPVSSEPNRSCGNCGKQQTTEGHDGCIGTLHGVMNACCGHGSDDEAYIKYENGKELRGEEALSEMSKQNEVKCWNCGKYDKKSAIPPSKIYINYLSGTFSGKWQGEKNQQGCDVEYIKATCPDCTAPQPTDDEIDYGNEFNKAIEDYTCDQILEYFFFHRGYKHQSSKLKEQADEIEQLKEEISLEKDLVITVQCLEKQIESMKCCGNCKNYSYGYKKCLIGVTSRVGVKCENWENKNDK